MTARHRKPGFPQMGKMASNGYGWGQHVDKSRPVDGPTPTHTRPYYSPGSVDYEQAIAEGRL